MRPTLFVTSLLVLGFAGTAGSSQQPSANPLATQIHLQQTAVEQAPASGEAWLKLAELRQDAAQYGESEQAYHRAIALLRPAGRAELADALDHLATLYIECGQLGKAQPLEEKALTIREEEKDTLGAGVSHTHLSALLLGKGDFSAAEAEAGMAVSLLAPPTPNPVPAAGATPEQQMSALINLSLARCARNSCATAIDDLRRAREIAQAHFSANSLPAGFLDFLLGYALWKSGDNTGAAEPMRAGISEMAAELGWGHPTYLRAMRQYRSFLTQTGHATEAAGIAARITSIEAASARAESHPATASVAFLP